MNLSLECQVLPLVYRLLSFIRYPSHGGFNRDYHAETADGGEQLAVLNVFSRHEDGIPSSLDEREHVQARQHQPP